MGCDAILLAILRRSATLSFNLFKFAQMTSERTREEVRSAFAAHGVTVAQWAQAHGFRTDSVYAVLLGRTRGTRGESHRISVALGLKAPAGVPNPMASPVPNQDESTEPQPENPMPTN
jgi:gp16 family phage-associated protein